MPRETEFPFKLTREHEPAPAEFPLLNVSELSKLNKYLTSVKKPVLDDITGAPYNFGPNKRAVRNYTGYYEARRAITARLENTDSDTNIGEDLVDISELARKPTHVAESAERHHGFFLATAETRKRMLQHGIDKPEHITTSEPQAQGASVWAWCIDAVVDVGYCLKNPVSIPSPSSQNPKYNSELANNYYGIGRYLEEDKLPEIPSEKIISAVMRFALLEQDRRIDYHKSRYDAVVQEYGTQAMGEKFVGNPTVEELLELTPSRQVR